MQQPHFRRAARLFGAGVLALGLAVMACTDQPPLPVTPTPPGAPVSTTQTLTITANGVFPSLAYIDANLPVTIVNNDTEAHQLHLDVEDQPGCGGFDLAGVIPPGESRLTGLITSDAAGCDVHDHVRHGDKRFSVQLVVGEGLE
jgi:hypothetical protein